MLTTSALFLLAGALLATGRARSALEAPVLTQPPLNIELSWPSKVPTNERFESVTVLPRLDPGRAVKIVECLGRSRVLLFVEQAQR